jgi:predicted phosphodiesterase
MSWIYAQETTRFIVVSDPHNNSPVPIFRETILYEIVLAAIDEEVDFIFFAGDLVIRGFADFAEEDSVLKDWRFVLDTLSIHNIKVFACRGNNDLTSKESWDSLFSGPYAFPQNGPENEKNITYTLEQDNIIFIALDQYTDNHRSTQTWLDSILIKNQKTHIFAAGHEPAFNLFHNSYMGAYPTARDSLWESLLSAGAKIYFSGHDHFYDHTIIDDGDENSENDMHQVIVGTGSNFHNDSEYNGDNGRWTPVRLFHEQANGYALVEVTDSQMKMTWKHRTEPGVFVDGGDNFVYAVTEIDKKTEYIPDYTLQQNYPNPFNPSTKIKFALPKTDKVKIELYNTLGQRVETLLNQQIKAGDHEVEFNANNLSSGIYYYRIEVGDPARRTGEFQDVKKMILLR